MLKIALETLGCKLNQAETELLSRQFVQAGCSIVAVADKADIYILNSCTVTHVADRKARHLLRLARRLNPAALIVVTGCYAERDSVGLGRTEGVDLVIGNKEKMDIAALLKKWGHLKPSGSERGADRSARTRSFIRIQDGCNNYCAYCIVPLVRGREKSQPPDSVIAEIRQREQEGYREVVLTGTEIGRYHWEGLDLRGLLDRILAETGIERIRLSSLQPQEVNNGLVRIWRDERLCPHFHLSLQSGSDSVLKRMGRRYNLAEYAIAVDFLRSEIPAVAISTDIIAGFPGETEEEFRESSEFCRRLEFARIHVFPFSAREGTRAASFPGQISPATIRERSASLLNQAKTSLCDFNRGFLSQSRLVLFEQKSAGLWTGLTDNYIRVYVTSQSDLANRLLPVKLVELKGDGVRGELSEI
jgi:threonylcarbamoyladenosine tRNA methylthiotransferase MtaB